MQQEATNKVLAKYRKQLLQTDKQLIQLLQKRFAITDKIGKLKAEQNLKVTQQNFWAEASVERIDFAAQKSVDTKLIESIFSKIHTQSKKQQQKYFIQKAK